MHMHLPHDGGGGRKVRPLPLPRSTQVAVFSPSMLYPGSHEKRALSPSAVPVISTSPLVGASGSAHVAVQVMEGRGKKLGIQ